MPSSVARDQLSLLVVLAMIAGCDSLLGLGDLTERVQDGGVSSAPLPPPDAGVGGDAGLSDGGGLRPPPSSGAPLRIGMPTVLQGATKELGLQMKRGVETWFKQVNDKGGIKGSQPLVLVPVNDDEEPAGATKAIQQLLDIPGTLLANNCATTLAPPDCVVDQPDTLGPNHVLSILGQVGTSTMAVTAPVCIRNKVIYFGPFTGAQRFLRDSGTTSDVIFNYRAGYYEEEAAVVDFLFRTQIVPVKDPSYIIGFTQQDTFGDAGYNGFRIAYQTKFAALADGVPKRINYTRGDLASVDKSAADTLVYIKALATSAKDAAAALTPPGVAQSFSFGIFMVPAYGPAARYIKLVKDGINNDDDLFALAKVTFMNVSFVGADALVGELSTLGQYAERGTGTMKYYGEGVWVTQVVPYFAASLPGIVQYRSHIQAFDGGISTWGSLEGYLAARLFTEGLDHATAYDTPSMIKAYESIKDFDLGIGPKVGFDNALPEGHQASHTIWLSQIRFNPTAHFDVPWLWRGPVGKDNQIVAP